MDYTGPLLCKQTLPPPHFTPLLVTSGPLCHHWNVSTGQHAGPSHLICKDRAPPTTSHKQIWCNFQRNGPISSAGWWWWVGAQSAQWKTRPSRNSSIQSRLIAGKEARIVFICLYIFRRDPHRLWQHGSSAATSLLTRKVFGLPAEDLGPHQSQGFPARKRSHRLIVYSG